VQAQLLNQFVAGRIRVAHQCAAPKLATVNSQSSKKERRHRLPPVRPVPVNWLSH
jgi:hypothetical protein